MTLTAYIPLAGGAAAVLAALLVLWRTPRSVAKGSLLGALVLLAVESVLAHLTLARDVEGGRVAWQQWKSAVMGLEVFPLLVFSLSYGRGNSPEFLRQWRWVLGGVLAAGVAVAAGVAPGAGGRVARGALGGGFPVCPGPGGQAAQCRGDARLAAGAYEPGADASGVGGDDAVADQIHGVLGRGWWRC